MTRKTDPGKGLTMTAAPSARLAATLAALMTLALVWRLAVGAGQVGAAGAGTDPESVLRLILGVMGLVYLFCGWIAFSRTRSAASGLFALHGLCQGIHWGGPLVSSSATVQAAIWYLYFVISMLGASALLHFTLLFPRRWGVASRGGTRWVLYLPVALAALLGIGALVVPSPGSARETLQRALFLLEAVQVSLYALLAVAVVAVRFARAGGGERRAFGLGVMLAGSIVALLPYVVVTMLQSQVPFIRLPGGLGAQPYTLFFVLMPVAFAHAILRSRAVDERAPAA